MPNYGKFAPPLDFSWLGNLPAAQVTTWHYNGKRLIRRKLSNPTSQPCKSTRWLRHISGQRAATALLRSKVSGSNRPCQRENGVAIAFARFGRGELPVCRSPRLALANRTQSHQPDSVQTNTLNFMLAAVKAIEPKNEVEAMLAAQMAAIHGRDHANGIPSSRRNWIAPSRKRRAWA
jgi:hypothetical protein